MKVADISSIEDAIAILRHYFPNSAAEPEKQVFLLKRMSLLAQPIDAPEYPLRSR